MTHHENLKIITLIGDNSVALTNATKHFTEKGFPKVHIEDPEKGRVTERITDQIHHLVDAGQHRIIIAGVQGSDELKELQQTFPGEMTIVNLEENTSIELLDRIATEIGFSS